MALTFRRLPKFNDRMGRQFSTRFVAFVDILGFKSIVDRMEMDPILFRTVRDALKLAARQSVRFGKYRRQTNSNRTKRRIALSFARESKLEMAAFSDSFVVSDTFPAWHVLAAVQAIGSNFLQAGILTRGGVVQGEAYHRGRVLFGPAVNEAHYLESEVARYPRILVSPAVVRSAWGYHEGICKGRLFIKDDDGSWFVNVIAPTLSTWEALSELTRAQDEASHLQRVREMLVRLRREAARNPAHLSKVTWLVAQYNATADCLPIDTSNELG